MPVYFAKTYYDCIDKATDIAASFGRSLKNRTIVFCEDKLTLSIEQSLIEKTGGSFNAEVSSFGRYIKKRLPVRKSLSKEGAAMAVKKIISNFSRDLPSLGKLHASPAFAAETSELIAQLKSAKVKPDDILRCVENLPENSAGKIRDVAFIYGKYEEFLKERGLTDSNNSLEEMVGAIESDEDMKNTRVIVAGFSSVTRQSRDVSESLLKNALSCDFIAVTGENEYLYSSEFADFIVKLTEEKPIYIPTKAEEEGERLLNGLFRPEYYDGDKKGEKSPKIRLYEAENAADEVDYVASYIRREVLDKGLRYKDIAIATGNLADYSLSVKRRLSDYDVPFYADEKKNLSSSPLARLAFDAVRVAARKGPLSDINGIISNGCFISDKELSDRLVRAMRERSVTAKAFINDFLFDDMEMDAKRAVLASFVRNFPRTATAERYVSLTLAFLKSACAEENAEILAERLSAAGAEEERAFLSGSKDDFYDLLNQISDILGSDEISAEEFYKILLSGAEEAEISLIPRSADCVFVGDLKDCRYRKYRELFVIGLSGDVPKIKGDTALLSDSDIAKLDELSVSIEPKIRVVNKREKEACALSLACFTDKLFLSCPLSSPSGAQTVKSDIMRYASNIFSTVPYNRNSIEKAKLTSEGKRLDELESIGYLSLRPALLSLVSDGESFKSGEKDDLAAASSLVEALKTFDGGAYEEKAVSLLDGVNADLPSRADVPSSNYFTGDRVSASMLEKFYACPYSCFAAYGLGLTDAASPEMQSFTAGRLFHSVAEIFIKKYADTVKDGDDLEEKAALAFSEAFATEDYARFSLRPDYAYAETLFKKEAARLCKNIMKEYAVSSFRPESEEAWFGDGGKYKAVKIPTSHGEYKLSGFADRIDRYKDYVRIIDYKTGDAKSKAEDAKFYTGRNLQLFLYLNAFTADGSVPAGAYYYGVNDKFSDGEEPPLMYGKTLGTDEVLLATDKNFLAANESGLVEGNRLKPKNLILGEKQMKSYMKYAKIMAERAAESLASGVITASPYEHACDYCEYRALCGFDADCGKKYRSGGKRANPSVIEKAADSEKEKTFTQARFPEEEL